MYLKQIGKRIINNLHISQLSDIHSIKTGGPLLIIIERMIVYNIYRSIWGKFLKGLNVWRVYQYLSCKTALHQSVQFPRKKARKRAWC